MDETYQLFERIRIFMTAKENLDKEFNDFVNKVFPSAGEAQMADMYTIWYAAVFSATNEAARSGDLTGVHIAAFDCLKEINETALIQIRGF